jgi:uncharacterized membrane protein YdjX (TVP38/TMEM64 family)
METRRIGNNSSSVSPYRLVLLSPELNERLTRIKKLASLFRQLASYLTPRTVIAATVLFVVLVAFLVLFKITNAAINPASIRATLAQFGAWAPLALIVALAVVLVVPIIPASVFQIGAGLVFGPWLGLLYVLVADFCGASIGFWLARAWGKSLLARYLSPATQTKLANLTERISWRGVILLRLLPGPAYPLVSLASGYSSLRFGTYTLASLLGVFPGLALLVLAGDVASSSPILAFVIVALLILSLIVASRLLNRKSPEQNELSVK